MRGPNFVQQPCSILAQPLSQGTNSLSLSLSLSLSPLASGKTTTTRVQGANLFLTLTRPPIASWQTGRG